MHTRINYFFLNLGMFIKCNEQNIIFLVKYYKDFFTLHNYSKSPNSEQ